MESADFVMSQETTHRTSVFSIKQISPEVVVHIYIFLEGPINVKISFFIHVSLKEPVTQRFLREPKLVLYGIFLGHPASIRVPTPLFEIFLVKNKMLKLQSE